MPYRKPINLLQNWQFLYVSLLALFIPYGITYVPYMFIGIFLWYYFEGFKKVKAIKTKISLLFFSFAILHVISILYSTNKISAIHIAEAKIGFVFFPLILSNYSLQKEELQKILHFFCFSNIFLATSLIIRSLACHLFFKCPFYTYSIFAWFIHPSYCAFYMIFSIAILYLSNLKLAKSYWADFLTKLALSTILVIGVLFCSSKIGLITLVLLVIFLSIYFVIKSRTVYYSALFLLILTIPCFIFIKYVPSPLQRLHAMLIDYNNTKDVSYTDLPDFNKETMAKGLDQKESGLARIFLWNAAKPVIKEHFLFGVGTGDVLNSMIISAKNEGLDTLNSNLKTEPEKNLFLYGAYKSPNYNMHNQYIETQMGLGIPGSILLLLIMLGILIFSFVKKDLLLSIFLILVMLNFFVESMLQWDYFCFFFSLFLFLFVKANTYENHPEINTNAAEVSI